MGTKVVKDLVHGYISIDEKIQRCVDTANFQRLHRVKQLTCNLLFPSVNHTRYEHSLGVMHLACQFFDTLDAKLAQEGKSKEDRESLREHLRFAALLHDVGHPPFSHLGEKFLKREEIRRAIEEVLPEGKNFEDIFAKAGSPHELLSCYSIWAKFQEVLPADLDKAFLCRMIVGHRYEEEEKWAENVCVEILNSSSIDVDKLDYLMRDNHMTGQLAPLMDIPRFLASLSLDTNRKLCFVAKALPAVQSVVDSRDSLYLWVYHHHISVYTDFLLGEMLTAALEEGALEAGRFFSPKAVVEDLMADDDVYSFLRGIYIQERGRKSYLGKLSQQFFERDFLKSLWKTIYEYQLLEEEWKQEGILPKESMLEDYLDSRERFTILEEQLREALGLEKGELFFLSHHHKFYHSLDSAPVEVLLDGERRKLSELLPQKNFERFHHKTFYLYLREDKKQEANRIFPEELRKFLRKIS